MISKELTNDCVGCETCMNCGRKEDYYDITRKCDRCSDEVDTLYELDGEQLCGDCFTMSSVCKLSHIEIMDKLINYDLFHDFRNSFLEENKESRVDE